MKLLLAALAITLLIISVFYWRAHRYDERAVLAPPTIGTATAYFAGGCFWCTESDFEKLSGVSAIISGYAGGTTTDPTYTSVSSHTTGHLEAVEVRYDPSIVSYQTLVEYFFAHIDPTDQNGQFVDQGDSYRSAVFYQNEGEQAIIIREMERLAKSGAYDRPLVTALQPFTIFYPAEEYHQDYSTKNPTRYRYYRGNSGRDQYLERICQIRATKNVPCLKAQ